MSYFAYSAGITFAFILGVVCGIALAGKIMNGGSDDDEDV